nr:unnamed protein product [Spirometra erinaceieuropaei]
MQRIPVRSIVFRLDCCRPYCDRRCSPDTMDKPQIKPESGLTGPSTIVSQSPTPVTPSGRRTRGRGGGSRGGRTPKRPRTSTGETISSNSDATPRSRGRKRGSTTNVGKRGRGAATPATKAGKSAVSAGESITDYFVSDAMLDSPPEPDQDEDVAEDSEYAPSEDERSVHASGGVPHSRKGAASGTRGQKRLKAMQQETDEEDEEEDEDDDDDDESDSDSELENDAGLSAEVSALRNSADNSGVANLFQDDETAAAGAAATGGKDIYDFDAQSILSDKRFRNLRRKSARAVANTTQKTHNTRQVRSSNAAATSWGSNVYSALATSLKTRSDLDAYTNFLKCPYLNSTFDSMFVEICKPSNQHAGLFFGPSSSLQSLMGRVNDPDRVVELLHAFMSKPYDNLANRLVWFAPMIHQQPVPMSNLALVSHELASLAPTLDPDLRIEPAYLLDGNLNVLVQTGPPFTDLVVSLAQYNAINSAGNVGRFMTDVSQIVVSNDFYEYLNDLVALPMEKIIGYAERAGGNDSVNIDALDPPCLHRLIAAVNHDSQLIGIALTDTWSLDRVPFSRNRRNITFSNSERSAIPISEFDRASKVSADMSVELDAYNVIEKVIETISRSQGEGQTESHELKPAPSAHLQRIHMMDCFLLKPNGRKDTILLVCYEPTSNPPLPPKPSGTNAFRIYSLVDEERFFFLRFGIASDLPALMEGMFTADPEKLIERKAVAILPDNLFDNLKSVCLREVIASSGSAIVNSILTQLAVPATPSNAHDLYQCTKFILVDSQRRVPLAIVFEAPIRLAWSTESTECSVRSSNTSVQDEFISISPEALRAGEEKFSPEASECRLVVINGLMYALQVDENRVVQRLVELVPARFQNVVARPGRESVSAQAITGDLRSYSAFMRVFNEESCTSSVFPVVIHPHYNQQAIAEYIANFCDEIADHFYTSPVAFSLYDIVFRMALKHTPKMLALQHREAAEAAAAAAAAANPHDPPPAPVPLPEHWGVCCICSKELHSVCGLLEHELRHVGLTRFRCDEHGLCFVDRRALLQHINEHPTAAVASKSGQEATGSDQEEDDEEPTNRTVVNGEGDQVLQTSLARVFQKNILEGRMEAPQCEVCHDYFPTADVMAIHMEICDGVSFRGRSPLAQAAQGNESQTEGVVCGICGQSVSSTSDIQPHFVEAHLSCVICKSKLRTIEEISYHYKVHIDQIANRTNSQDDTELLSQVMTCETCLTFYCTKYNYYFHQWAEHGVVYQPSETDPSVVTPIQVRIPRVKPVNTTDEITEPILTKIKCKFCNFLSPISGKQYVAHLQSMHDITTDINRICRICGEVYATMDELSVHLQEQHVPSGEFANAGSQTVFSCDQCSFFAFSKGMLCHAAEIHNNFSPMMYHCPHCHQRFDDRRVWRSHLDKHTEGSLHTCNECGKEFRSRQALLHHVQMRHVDWDDGPATCEHCGITYPKQSSLRYHIARMHNQEMEHECPVCQQRFRVETYLRRHMKETHSGAIQCEICQKMCANLRCYSQHRQKHFRTKIFQCKECSATFKSKTAMRRHVRVEHMQLGPEKFECQICGKIVTQIGMHMLTHKDARFECEYCGKRFTKSVYYNEHIRIHRGELPFECHICRRRFNKKSNLNVHIKFHEKHRDEEGNYLELKARGRVSIMFGDASLTPEERAAKEAAMRLRGNKVKVSVACGSDYPGAFNIGGPAGAAADACAAVVPVVAYLDADAGPNTAGHFGGQSALLGRNLTTTTPQSFTNGARVPLNQTSSFAVRDRELTRSTCCSQCVYSSHLDIIEVVENFRP